MLMSEGQYRSLAEDRKLAWSLAFVAGAVNAGGFLAIGRYTSHMTGIVSSMSDESVLGHWHLFWGAVGMLIAFTSGAMISTFLTEFAGRRRLKSKYALSLLLETMLLLLFGIMAARLHQTHVAYLPWTALLLCTLMGIQNALVTTISGARVRTTHLTGIITDIGIELSRLIYRKQPALQNFRSSADLQNLQLHSLILAAFFVGGVAGALGFKYIGFKTSLFLALFLGFLAIKPIWFEIKVFWRMYRARHPN